MNGGDSAEFFNSYIIDYGVSQRFFPLYTFALNINFPICALAFWKAGGRIKTCTNINNFPQKFNGCYLVIN